MAKDINIIFKKDIQMANKYLKNMFNSVRNQIHTEVIIIRDFPFYISL
jgi:hypothetical protein